jgi:Carboxypeptidase regulatory-like domain
MKKFVSMLFAATLLLAVSCGKGKEASVADEGEDDQAPQHTATNASSTQANAPAAAAAPASPDAATIAGTIKLDGAAPKMPVIQMGADPYCASQHKDPVTDEEVVVGPAGELANVFVYVKNPPAGNYAPPAQPATLDQKGCKYYPHVSGLQVGQKLDIKNDDATLHNVHGMPNNNAQFNEGQPVQGMVASRTLDKPEMVPFKIKCDVHGWMKSYMAVLPHPFFAVSQMNGQFTIPNLPPGSYTLVAWHEKYGTQEQQITVGPKESKQVAFTFKG